MTRRAARPAFTLIEVIIALVASLFVLGICLTIVANTVVEGRRTRIQAEMARDATHTSLLLDQELRQTGLGVPSGGHINGAYGSSTNVGFYASLLVANVDQVGVVGDLSRDDASYNAYGPLHNRGLLSNTILMWHTENNGSCAPDAVILPPSCTTGTTSVFFPGEDGCNGAGTTRFQDRTCPWGLRRVLPNEHLIIVDGAGRWGHAALSSAGTIDVTVLPLLVFGARLGPGWSPADWPDPPAPAVPVVHPAQVAGQGWVATLDRVFYKYDAGTRTIQRMHCTGDPDPDNANWPGPTATTIPASPAFTPAGGTANVCGPFEVIARHVDRLTLTYFDETGAALPVVNTAALKKSVRRIGYSIQFRQALGARDVIYDTAGSVRLQNL